MIERSVYLDRLNKVRDLNVIKVVTGVRRCGKSTLLSQFADKLIAGGVKKRNIVNLNFEEMKNESLSDRHLLHGYIEKVIDEKNMNYVFLDEIQKVSEFEKLVDSLYVKKNIDLYITGSNANLLSSEIATILSGRYIEINILPLSFSEFVLGHKERENKERGNVDEIFADYITYGGFPEVSNFLRDGASSEVGTYLSSLISTVVEKDIKTRREIRNMAAFNEVYKFVLDSVGSMVSPNKIAERLKADKTEINKATVQGYLSDLTDAQILYKASRYDIRGKKILQTLDKYYSCDIALIRQILGKSQNIDRGHILENLVYLELRKRGGNVFVGKEKNREVDFVHKTIDGEIKYYQVTESMQNKEARERELRPLQLIEDNNEKYVLTSDFEEANYKGIRQVNLVKWLLA